MYLCTLLFSYAMIDSTPIPWSFVFEGNSDNFELSEAAKELFQDMLHAHGIMADDEETTNAPEIKGRPRFPLLNNVNKYIQDCMARGDCEDYDEITLARPVRQLEIEGAVARVMAARSILSPLWINEQDELHERLHTLYELGLLPKNQFSLYLKFFAHIRQTRIQLYRANRVTSETLLGVD